MFKMTKLKPVNRHLLVIPHKEEKQEEQTGVLLPEGYTPNREKYALATVVDVSVDCSKQFLNLSTSSVGSKVVVVDNSMLEEVKVNDKTHCLILENYVVGILRNIDEN